MANGTPQAPQAPQPQQQQMDELTKKLLMQALQKRTQVQPSAGAPQPSQPMAPMAGLAHSQDEGRQMFVHNLFALIHNAVGAEKNKQIKHATGVLQSLNNSWLKAQEMTQGDQEKAMSIFSQLPEVTHILEDKKNVKQLGKLLQFDFLNTEKSKTVWHEALGRVVEAGKAFGLTQAIQKLIGEHKAKQSAQSVQGAGDFEGKTAAKEQEASGIAKMFAGKATPDTAQGAEASKLLPSMLSQQGQDLREHAKYIDAEYMQQMKNDFAKSIDSIKNPIDKAIARSMLAAQEGRTEDANKFMDLARKGAEAKKPPSTTMNLNKAITDLGSTDPDVKKVAQNWIDNYDRIQEKLVSARGTAFGMSRLYNFYNEDTGETTPLNGFQAQQKLKEGENWTMTSPVSTDKLLGAQQIVITMNNPDAKGTSLRQRLQSDMKVFDNAFDRAIIARIKTANPNIRALDEGTLGTWIDQNLTGKLSDEGKQYMQDIKQYGEVFIRSRAVTGQTSSEMNTSMLLGLLPDEKTPNRAYGEQKLQQSFNFLDGTVGAPILGGGKFKGKSKAAAKDDKKVDVDSLLDKHFGAAPKAP